MKKILIIGGASAIATETAKLFAKEGHELFLVDLNLDRLSIIKDEINTFYPIKISTYQLDVNDFDKYNDMFETALNTMGFYDILFIAHGTLPNQNITEKNNELIIKEINTNSLSVMLLASKAASYFEERKSGSIAVISSVAGDRGRQSNYIYGSAKGGVSIFLQGLRNRLSKSNINVLTIKPGFVDTPMTSHMDKNLLYASPKSVGKSIFEAISKRKDILYVPGYWRLIMFIIKHIPEGIFKKLNL